jgi:hypothetical protein
MLSKNDIWSGYATVLANIIQTRMILMIWLRDLNRKAN